MLAHSVRTVLFDLGHSQHSAVGISVKNTKLQGQWLIV